MEPNNNPDDILTIKELLTNFKVSIYTFLGVTVKDFFKNTVINLYTLEGMLLSALVHFYPSHAQEIVYFFATYLFYKPTKKS